MWEPFSYLTDLKTSNKSNKKCLSSARGGRHIQINQQRLEDRLTVKFCNLCARINETFNLLNNEILFGVLYMRKNKRKENPAGSTMRNLLRIHVSLCTDLTFICSFCWVGSSLLSVLIHPSMSAPGHFCYQPTPTTDHLTL